MNEAEFTKYVSGEPIIPNLPRFERKMLIKYGKSFRHIDTQEQSRIDREKKRMAYGKQPRMVTNTAHGKVLDKDCLDRIKSIIKQFESADTHNGLKVLQSVIVHLLTTHEVIHAKLVAWEYGYGDRHCRTYITVIESVLKSLQLLTLNDLEYNDDDWDEDEEVPDW